MDINKLADEVYSDDLDKLADEVYTESKESLFKKARKYAPMIASGPVGVTNLLAVQAAKKSMRKHEVEVEGQTPRGRIAETGAALSKGFLNLAEAGVGGIQKWTPASPGTPYYPIALARQVGRVWGSDKPDKMLEDVKQKIGSARERLPRTREGLGGWAMNVIGEGAPYLMATLATGGAAGWKGSAAIGFQMGGEQAYKEAKAAGASEVVAMRDYTLNGLTEAALEAWGVSKLLQFKSAGKGAMKSLVKNVSKGLWKKAGRDLANITGKMLKSAVVEGLEEASQSAAGFAVAALPGGKKLPRKADGSIDWWAIISQIGEEAAGGALLGAIVPHGGSAIEIGGQRAMDVTPKRLQRTIDMVKNSNLNEVQKARMLREVHAIGEKKGQVYTEAKPAVEGKKRKVYYHGSTQKIKQFEGAEYFTDAVSEASTYAEMAALRKAVDKNDELNEIVGDILAEEGGEDITDLSVQTIHDIVEANNINVGKKLGKGAVTEVNLDFKNPADLTKYGSEIGSENYVGETWNELYEDGLLDEGPFESFDEEVQDELKREYADKAIYKLFEKENVFKKAFDKGHDAIIFTDQGLSGKTKHTSYLVKDKSQIQPTAQNNPDISPKSLETVDKLADNLARLEPRRGELGKEMKKRKAAQAIRQAEALQKAIEEGADPVVAAKISQKAGEGMLKSLVPEVREGMAREDQVTLQRIINEDQRIEQFERGKLNNVMKAIFDDRVQPSRSEVKAFDRFFGTNVFQMGKRYAPMWQKALRFAWDAATKVPRAYLCSVDNSFAGVQAGIFGGTKHPKVFARDVAQGLKMLASADYAKLTEIEIKTNPLYEQALHDGLPIEGKEEYFESDLAEKIPLIGFIPRVSNRAFSNGLHKLRLDYYKLDMDANQEAAQNGSWRKQIADHIGNITGSGKMPGRDTRIGKFISEGASAVLWAHKLYVGTTKTWTDIITKPAIRKTVAADLIKPIGVGIAILALVKAMFPDKVEVELDPTSSDFARIKHGNTRINFFGQHQQMARLVAQLALGKTKSTATGRFTKVQRHKIILRYLRFKLNPATAVPVDVATGTTALGERMRYEPEFMAGYTAEHVTPLFLQDMVDAVRYQGWNTAMAIAPAAFHGIATQTYEKNARAELADLRNHYAHEIFGVDWDQLGPDYQKVIAEARPILDEYKRKAAIEAEDFNYQSRMQEEQRQMGRAIRKALPKKVQHVFEDLGISTSIGRRISSNWYLDEKRYKEYQKGVTELLKNNIPKIINQPKWGTLDKAVQYEYLQGVVKAAKDYVRGEIVAKANFEDYQRTQIGELPE